VVTNISSGYVEYCHVKTTPYLPVIDAIRMTLATPGETTPNSTIFTCRGLLGQQVLQCHRIGVSNYFVVGIRYFCGLVGLQLLTHLQSTSRAFVVQFVLQLFVEKLHDNWKKVEFGLCVAHSAHSSDE